MFDSEARVLVILPRDLLDRARALAGRATTSLRLPVSLQIVLRALIEEGLKDSKRSGSAGQHEPSGRDGSPHPPGGAPADRDARLTRSGDPITPRIKIMTTLQTEASA